MAAALVGAAGRPSAGSKVPGELTEEFGHVGRDSVLVDDLRTLKTELASTYNATQTIAEWSAA